MKWKNPNFSSSDQHQYMCNINRKLDEKKKKKSSPKQVSQKNGGYFIIKYNI